MARGFFVTGTDTNVGKTVLSALLCAALPGIYWKPIQTGAREGTDRQIVLALTQQGEHNAFPETFIFDDPVSPHLAAQRANRLISLDDIRLPASTNDLPLIVEGAGGVLVPINGSQFMSDLIVQLSLPTILAARSTLGTINHTLLSLQALRTLSVPVLGVVLIGPSNPDNKEAIERFGKAQVIGEIPVLDQISGSVLWEVFANNFIREAFI